MDYRRGSHTTYRIEYHPAEAGYRHKVLRGDVAERLRELVRQTCERSEVEIVSGVVSADHVHILGPIRKGWQAPAPPSLRDSYLTSASCGPGACTLRI